MPTPWPPMECKQWDRFTGTDDLIPDLTARNVYMAFLFKLPVSFP